MSDLNEMKLMRGVQCLKLVAIIQAVVHAYSLLAAIGIFATSSTAMTAETYWKVLSPSTLPALLIVGAALFTMKELKAGRAWAWVSALGIFLLTLGSFAFPVSIFGILSLMDRDVRGPFITELDIKL